MEMGFDEKEVMDALRVNNNQQSAAVSTGPGVRASRGTLCASQWSSGVDASSCRKSLQY